MLEIDGGLLEKLFEEKFGDTTKIPEEWWPYHGSGSSGPHRSVIWRWRRANLVPKESNFWVVAVALDVDPCLLVRLPKDTTFIDFCIAVADGWWGGSWKGRIKKFSFFKNLILGEEEWPPSEKVRANFKRDWQRIYFSHVTSVRKNYYAAFLITPQGQTKNRVWHFAWRDRWRPWRPYGIVIARESEIHLYCFDGRESIVAVQTEECDRFIVETWFGPNNAEFCLASLHDFSAELFDGNRDLFPVVKFSIDDSDDSRPK